MEQKMLLPDYVWLALAWTVYYVLHSWLASNQIKALIEPRMAGFYRLGYTILATIGLAPLGYMHIRMESEPWFTTPVLVGIGLILMFAGVAVMLMAFRAYDLPEFIGLRKSGNDIPEKSETLLLVTTGLQGWVRHPLYLGGLLAIWGYCLARPSVATLIFAGITTMYIPIGAMLEERKLREQFGQAYREYQQKVPMLIPKFRLN